MANCAAVRGAAERQDEVQRHRPGSGRIELSAPNVADESPQRAGLLAEGGSESITVFSSPGRRASARAGWPVRLATKLAERISPSPITAFPGCLQRLPSREATDVMAGSSSNSPKPTFSFSMTGDRKNSMMTSGVMCLRSLKTATNADRSQRLSHRSHRGSMRKQRSPRASETAQA